MSEVHVVSDRFWNEFKSDVAGTLSAEQREEIDRVLGRAASAGSNAMSDLRLSCKWFFVRLAWGLEKRKPERIKKEEEMYPPFTLRNIPALLSLFAGYVGFWVVTIAFVTVVLFYSLN